MRALLILVLGTTLALGACVGETTDIGTEYQALAGTDAELLAFLNDQSVADFDMLDLDCGIRSDSARQIIRHRDGHDRTAGTSDDDLFDDVAELDSVAMVGPWTINRLSECACDLGYCGDCVPEPFDLDNYREMYDYYDFEDFYGVTDFGPELNDVIATLLVDAEGYRHTQVYFPMEFSSVETYSLDGKVHIYTIRFRQWIDPPGGVVLWVNYTVDSCLNSVDTHVYI